MLVPDDSGARKEVVFHRADVKPHVPVLQPGSRGAGPLWPVAAPILLLCSHSQPRAAQRGHWAGLHSAPQQACYAHGSLARAARDGGSKTEPPTPQAASGSADPHLYRTTSKPNAAVRAHRLRERVRSLCRARRAKGWWTVLGLTQTPGRAIPALGCCES